MSREPFIVLVLLSLPLLAISGQTPVDVHRNKYTPAQDVQLGRQAAAEVEQQQPILRDGEIDGYIDALGGRLVDALPPERRNPEFRYSFTVLNQQELNAFALPGGPIYVYRGMLEASNTEGEAAGVVAHELSHIVLRHGTAQATAASKFQIGQVAGQILGSIVGGSTGAIIAQGSGFGLGTYFLKYSREFERESDLLGAQILARAGYDPREMAQMFRTLEAQGGSRAPEWMSTHPNPGNRYETINREAALLRVETTPRRSTAFSSIQARLRSIPGARSTPQQTRPVSTGGRRRNSAGRSVELPSSQYRTVQADIVSVAVPANWQQDSTDAHLTFTPAGAVYQGNGVSAFTHGIQVGTISTQSRDLASATEEVVRLFNRSNPGARSSGSRRDTLAGRPALRTELTNVSEVTGQPELVTLSTAQLRDGTLLYLIATAPQAELRTYESVFQRVRQSLQIND
ncbi:MAG: M48 family metalloprotease [Cyanobacteria bacterium]|nr:M48 family metalloprotease [Cyanobacteriota bacterium]